MPVKKLKNSTIAIKQKISYASSAIAKKAGETFGSIVIPLSQKEILKWLKTVTDSAATDYDRAADKVYRESHLGGGNHRLFDGGHTIEGIINSVREAKPDDTFAQEIAGSVTTWWKDVTTPKGLPFATLDPNDYSQWVNSVTGWIPGISKEWLYGLLSYDASKLFSASLGAVGAVFFLKNDDIERLSEILGAMGISSIITANPILGLITIVITAYTYVRKKKKIAVKSSLKGASVVTLSATLFAILGLHIAIEFCLVIFLTSLFKNKILENGELLGSLSEHIQIATTATLKNGRASVSNITDRIGQKFRPSSKGRIGGND